MIKLKKVIALFLVGAIIGIFFVGCSEQSQIEKAQSKIVSIGEQFLNYELTIDEAETQLESIANPSTDCSGASSLSADKNFLKYLNVKSRNNKTVFDEIKEKIQYIKKHDYN